jgi:8-oxo-dGTP pyrophosphatase MutT (NUDIX family)
MSLKKQEPIAQACVIPLRYMNEQPEVCLITSLKNQRWIFPKGIIDPGETLEEAALKEAFEEAGLHGQIVGEPLGSYEDGKWGTNLKVAVVIMEVSRSDERWLEADVRERCWVTPEEALRILSKNELKKFLELALKQMSN